MGYTNPHLDVRRIGTDTAVSAENTSLTLRASLATATAKIVLTASGAIEVYPAASNYFLIYDGATNSMFAVSHSAGDVILDGGAGLADHNLFLRPNGTGKIKFGTYVPGLVVCTGTVPFIDSAGNARNLMVQS